ncbi:hypothetical protein TRIUR3_17099 [Triticum urartu]|uniref:Uncharacterized protein n=1 Tax=Triticum urartu TaxID=4572 RepID=M7YF03_TRIUA|nr:hypothetical protein TRIUR3_17099 [Triticum urartu]
MEVDGAEVEEAAQDKAAAKALGTKISSASGDIEALLLPWLTPPGDLDKGMISSSSPLLLAFFFAASDAYMLWCLRAREKLLNLTSSDARQGDVYYTTFFL